MSTATLSAAPTAAKVSWINLIKGKFLTALAALRIRATRIRLAMRRGYAKVRSVITPRAASIAALGAMSVPEYYTGTVSVAGRVLRFAGDMAIAGVGLGIAATSWTLGAGSDLLKRVWPFGSRVLDKASNWAARAGLWVLDRGERYTERTIHFIEDQLVHPTATKVVTTGAGALGIAIAFDMGSRGMASAALARLPFRIPAILSGGPTTWSFVGGMVVFAGLLGFLKSQRDIKALTNLADVAPMDSVEVPVFAPAGASQAEVDAMAQAELDQRIAAGEASLIRPARGAGKGRRSR